MNNEQRGLLEARIEELRSKKTGYLMMGIGSGILFFCTFWLIIPIIIFLPLTLYYSVRYNNTKKEIVDIEYRLKG